MLKERIEEIRKLRETMTQKEVAEEFGTTTLTVRKYETDENILKYIDKAKRRRVKLKESQEYVKKSRQYQKDYRRSRWKTDPEFRKRCTAHMSKWQKANPRRNNRLED